MTNQTSAAAKKPTPNPLCMKATARDRSRSGQVSATSVAPVLHSAPRATPVSNRSAAKDHQLHASAERPVRRA